MALIDQGLEDGLLKANEDAILAKLDPKMRRDVQRIVLAGMKVAIHGGPNGILRNLPTSKDPVRDCAIGAVNLAFMMVKSQNPTPSSDVLAATAYASYLLMFQALDVAAKMKKVEITPEVITQATKVATDRVLANMGLTPAKMNMIVSKVGAVTKNPEQMKTINNRIDTELSPRGPAPVARPATGG